MSHIPPTLHLRHPLNTILEESTTPRYASPLSDTFPTPRGFPTPLGRHFMLAPTLPSSPSTMSEDDEECWIQQNERNLDAMNVYNPYTATSHARDSVMTTLTEFDDLYDPPSPVSTKKRLPPLVIPSSDSPSVLLSPVLPTPSSALAVLARHNAFPVSATPSLDGSQSSEVLASFSAPVTPVEKEEPEEWSGVQLPPSALATLYSFSTSPNTPMPNDSTIPTVPSPAIETPSMIMMQRRPAAPLSPLSFTPIEEDEDAEDIAACIRELSQPTPVSPPLRRRSTRSSYMALSALEIPSPGALMRQLSPGTRLTWDSYFTIEKDTTSAIAESFHEPEVFYGVSTTSPVSRPSQVSDVPVTVSPASEISIEDPLPTSRPVYAPSTSEIHESYSPASEIIDTFPIPSLPTLSPHVRTTTWLQAQKSYLSGVSGDLSPSASAAVTVSSATPTKTTTLPLPKKVTFLLPPPTPAPTTPLPPLSLPRISAPTTTHHHAFTSHLLQTRPTDPFTFRLPRYEALLASLSTPLPSHLPLLFSKQQLPLPRPAPKRLSATVVRSDASPSPDSKARLRAARLSAAQTQIAPQSWLVQADKLLLSGSLLLPPVAAHLNAHVRGTSGSILDLGSLGEAGSRAWHLAVAYPTATVYSVSTKSLRQLSNSNISGPANHRTLGVTSLTRLPFPSNTFDAVLARDLHTLIKSHGPSHQDSWSLVLSEIFRILKPSGMLDFSLTDASLINAGPLTLAKSVEFAFTLRTLGYDPEPTKSFLSRLSTAGFADVKRTWLCHPVGPGTIPATTSDIDAASTATVAPVTGMLGLLGWQKWLLRCEMEKVAGEWRLADTVTTSEAMVEAERCLDGMAAVVEEARKSDAAFRVLRGCATKSV